MNRTLINILRKSPTVFEFLRKLDRLFNLMRTRAIQKKILNKLNQKKSVYFVQVGSNDGLQGDPLHSLIIDHDFWRGMFIEPVPVIFEKLKANYHNSERFTFVNKAISTESGSKTFYYVSESAKAELGDKLPYWYDQLGSFDRNHIVKHLEGILEPYIVEADFETMSMQEVFDSNGVNEIDLLHIDTEGFDFQVLSQVDFAKYKPSIVLYEHNHLSAQDKKSAETILIGHHYDCFHYGGDTLAILKA